MNFSPSQILDIVVLAFIAVAAIVGAIKGLFKCVINFAVIGLAVFLGYKIAPMVNPKVVDWVYPKVSDKLMAIAQKKNIDFSLLNQEQIDSVLKSIMTPVSRVVCWIVIAVVLMIILGLIGTMLGSLIEKTPGMKTTNKTLGAILGAVLAILVCYILVFGISKLGGGGAIQSRFPDSIAYKVLYSLVPKSSDVIGINLPGIGEINLKDFFRK